MSRRQLRRQASRCFADDLDEVDNGELHILVCIEALPTQSCSHRNLVAGFADVGESLVVTSHNAPASCSTRSRIRGFIPPEWPLE